jgi:pentatricopeptide repeat protein
MPHAPTDLGCMLLRIPCRKLVIAAQRGQPEVAEDVMQEMAEAGLSPGPRAYHGLVFAYAKSRNAEGALDAIRREYSAGIQPITESYVVLIHAFVQESKVEEAEATLASMKRAGLNARPGWLMLTTALFRAGYNAEAKQQVRPG